MTKQEQIEEIDELIRSIFHCQVAYKMNISKYGGYDGYSPVLTADIAEALYNAGYRKTFTSDLASDKQKAFKEGYIKGNTDGLLFARKEAIKEFAEKLKEKAYTNNYCQEVILKSEIDELLKEYEE